MKQNGTNLMFMLIIYGKKRRNFEKKQAFLRVKVATNGDKTENANDNEVLQSPFYFIY